MAGTIRPKDEPEVTVLAVGDKLLIDGGNGVRSILPAKVLESLGLSAAIIAALAPARALPPQGKLTLASGVPTMRSTIAGATAVLYTNAGAGCLPITVDGGVTFSNTSFSETTQNLSDTTKSPAAAVPNANYDYLGWFDASGSVVRVTRTDYWKRTATVTMTIASPCVVTWPGSAPADGTPVVLTTTGALATGLTAGTTVFCKSPSGSTSNLSATPGGAAINTTGSQSGVHTATYGDDTGSVARGVGGNCELDFTKLYPLNKNAVTNGPGAMNGVYLGSVRTNSAGTVDHIFCSSAAGFGGGTFGVWNAYNKERVNSKLASDSGGTYSTTNNTMNAAHNSATARIYMIRGLDVDEAEFEGFFYTVPGAATAMVAGFGLDSTTTFASGCRPGWNNSGVSNQANPVYVGLPGLGWHFVSANELNSTTTASNWRTTDATSGTPFGFSAWLWL